MSNKNLYHHYKTNSTFSSSSTNCDNILLKFYEPGREIVKKLSFISPETRNNKNDNNKTLEDEKQFSKTKNIDMIVLYRSLNILKKNIPNIPNLFPNSNSNKEQDTENIIYQRFEHIEIENNLKNNIKQINNEIKNNKKIRNEILSKLKILENEINDIEYNVNMLKNVNRFTMIEKEQIEMRNEIKRRKELIREKPKTRTLRLKPDIIEDNEEDDDDKNEKIIFGYFQSRINTMLNKNRINDENQLNLKLLRASQSREKKIEKIQDNLQKLYEKRKSLLKELNIILNNIENLKNSKHEKINILYMHYLKLLKSGIDTRSEGLSWIIKEIFALNKNVLMSYLPNFLDEECIKFIFKQANISIKLNEFDKEIHKKQEELFNLGINNSFNIGKNRNKNKTFFQSIQNQKLNLNSFKKFQHKNNFSNDFFDNNLFELTSTVPNLKLNEMEKLIKNRKKKITDEQMKKLIEYQNKIKEKESLKNFYENLKKNEMNRIFDEYLKNNYYQRFKVEKNVVLSALIGEDNILPELNKQAREAKMYFDSLMKVGLNNKDNNYMRSKKNIKTLSHIIGKNY